MSQLFPVAASKCEYDETSVNNSDGKAPSSKYAAVLSYRSLFSPVYRLNVFHGILRSVWQSGKPRLAAAVQLCAT